MTSTRAAAAYKTTVLIVAASAEPRARLQSLLSTHPEFEVLANTQTIARRSARPVVVFVADSDRASLASVLPAVRAGVIVLSENQNLNWIAHTSPREPIALLSPQCSEQQLMAAIRAVAAGLAVLESETLESLIRTSPDSVALEPGEEELTSRESEVLHMMTAGLTNREIATALAISEHTVKFHIASIFGKLGTTTRTETVTEGIRRGLILL